MHDEYKMPLRKLQLRLLSTNIYLTFLRSETELLNKT